MEWELITCGPRVWPDRIMYRRKEDGQFEAIFIVDKGNNRAIATDKSMVLELLQLLGQTVKISFNGVMMSLEEFNSGLGYKTLMTGLNRQQVYNARSELRTLEMLYQKMEDTDPRKVELLAKIQMRKKLVGAVVEDITPTNTANQIIEEEARKKKAQLDEWARQGKELREAEQREVLLNQMTEIAKKEGEK